MVQLPLSLLGMMRRLAIILPLTLIAVAGCSLKTPPPQSEVVVKALPQDTVIPVSWQAAADTGAVGNNWLKSFNDPQLEALVAEAMANNLDLDQAAENVTIALQRMVVVGARLRPQVGATLGGRATWDLDESGDFSSTIATVGVSWEMDVWGKLRARRAAAEAGYQATALDYAYARQSLAATVAKVWYLTIESRQLVGLAQESVDVFSEMLELVKLRRQGGKDTDLNIADTRAKLLTAQSGLVAAEAAFDESRRALEVLLGRYPAAEIGIAETFAPLPPPVTAGLPVSLLERRPDIVAAEREVLLAFRQEEAARLSLLPSFSLSLTAGRLGDQVLSLLNLAPWLVSAAVGAVIPIYSGGSLTAQVEIATAQQTQAIARYGSVVLAAFSEVENTLANEQWLTERLEWAQQALEARDEAVRIAIIQYKSGRRDLLWASTMQTAQIATQAAVIELVARQRLNRVQLHLALGGSFDETPALPPGLAQ